MYTIQSKERKRSVFLYRFYNSHWWLCWSLLSNEQRIPHIQLDLFHTYLELQLETNNEGRLRAHF